MLRPVAISFSFVTQASSSDCFDDDDIYIYIFLLTKKEGNVFDVSS